MQPEISSENRSAGPEELQVILTGDGTPTLRNLRLGETYHSRHGAKQESLHVFIHSGLKLVLKESVHVLEVGFGTGLNTTLTLLQSDKTIHYTAIEPYPVSPKLLSELNYFLDTGDHHLHLKVIHAEFNETTRITPNFHLTKQRIGLQDFNVEEKFDVVYFDAFAPMVQPEMWTKDVFTRLFKCMNTNGILVTYCAKGQVRRDMIAAGFKVERIAGPPGKREMLRAIKKDE